MNENPDIFHLGTKFFSICIPIALKTQVIYSKNKMIGQAQDNSYIYSHPLNEKMKGKKKEILSNFQNKLDKLLSVLRSRNSCFFCDPWVHPLGPSFYPLDLELCPQNHPFVIKGSISLKLSSYISLFSACKILGVEKLPVNSSLLVPFWSKLIIFLLI